VIVAGQADHRLGNRSPHLRGDSTLSGVGCRPLLQVTKGFINDASLFEPSRRHQVVQRIKDPFGVLNPAVRQRMSLPPSIPGFDSQYV
jgi:hypothetical protein